MNTIYRPFAALAALALLSACSSDAMKIEDITKVQGDCTNVDQKIAMLEKEKATNNKRTQAGVQSVLPVTAVYHLVTGNYKRNVSIATGEWASEVDLKLAELRRVKADCERGY